MKESAGSTPDNDLTSALDGSLLAISYASSSILAVAEGDDLEALWRLAIKTGMRRGELLGLKWADVDFDASALSVRRSLSRGDSSR